MNKYLKFGLAVVSVFTLLITSACAQLPKSGEIKTGPNIESGLENEYLYFSPSGPLYGASQEGIVLGFLNAGTGPQNDYEVAKSYLSNDFKTIWDPNNEVLIQDGAPRVTLNSNDSVNVIIPISAKINNLGQYQPMPEGKTETVRIKLSEEGGEWRISSAPNLITVIQPVFDVVFKSYAVYFFDNSLKRLVPDVRWFHSSASTSTRLVTALLGGPSSWLHSAARSAIPSGTELSLSTVTVADGVATVDLSSKALEATALERKMIQVQIHETLIQLNTVYSVNVTVQRSALDTNPINRSKISNKSSTPVALYKNQLIHVDSNSRKPIVGSEDIFSKLKATDFAINSEERTVLVTTKEGIYQTALGIVDQEPKLLAKGEGYLSPILDETGYSWVIPKSRNSPIMVFDPAGNRVSLPNGWLGRVDRLSFSVSNEGSRIVVATGAKQNSQVYVASIIRDTAGQPTGFGLPIKPIDQSGVQSVTWLDDTSIGVLSRAKGNYAQPWVVMVGGISRKLTLVSDGAKIIGSGEASSVFILDESSVVYKFRGSTWSWVTNNIDALHYRGN